MKNKLSLEFKNNCFNDIEEIFKEIGDFMPEIEIWQMNQSALFEDNKKILCRAILDNNDRCIGHQIKIDVYLDTLFKYRLNILENSIELNKSYVIDSILIEEFFKVQQEKEIIKRVYIYQEGDKYLKYNETYDTGRTKEERDSFGEISNNIKNCITKNKVKVRK